MMLLNARTRRVQLTPTLFRQIMARITRAGSPTEPDEGWFTFQVEPADRHVNEPTGLAQLAGNRGDSGYAPVALAHATQTRKGRLRLVVLGTAVLVTLALISTVAVIATTTGGGRTNAGSRNLVAQRSATVVRLTVERDQALVALRQAQTGQAAWRAQALRWRSRVLARRRAARRRARNGRRQITRRHPQT